MCVCGGGLTSPSLSCCCRRPLLSSRPTPPPPGPHPFTLHQAGDDVVVSGVVARKWGRIARGARFDTEVVIRANHVRMNNSSTNAGLQNEGARITAVLQ